MTETPTETTEREATETRGTSVDLWQKAYSALSSEVRERFALEDVKTIRDTVAPDLSAPEFRMFMALAAKYDLDPLAKEIWGAKGKRKDGSPGKVLIMVGRDGLLKVARRDGTYMGFDSDVVRENDSFEVIRTREGREIRHSYSGSPEARGRIVGAWAQVYQKGYHDGYFFAPMEEYCPANPHYSSAWATQPSVMISKCALSLCLRLAFNLSGIVSEEEAGRAFEDEPADLPAHSGLGQTISALPEDLQDRAYAAYSDAAELRPGYVTIAAFQMSTAGQTPERIAAYLDLIERENERARQERDAETTPTDAEVVEPEISETSDAESTVPDDRERRDDPPASTTPEARSPQPGSPAAPVASSGDDRSSVETLRRRYALLEDRVAAGEITPEEIELAEEELEWIRGELREAGADVPGQEKLL